MLKSDKYIFDLHVSAQSEYKIPHKDHQILNVKPYQTLKN